MALLLMRSALNAQLLVMVSQFFIVYAFPSGAWERDGNG